MPKQSWHAQSAQEVLEFWKTTSNGLTEDEVRTRTEQYGPNAIPIQKGESGLSVLVRQFTGPMVLILFVAMIGSLVVGENSDAVVISLAIIINAGIGFVQERKADRAAQLLKSYQVPHCIVRRSGQVIEIVASELVPGDIVLMNAGTCVPADIRLTKATNVETDEALLTGESLLVKKEILPIDLSTPVAERSSMLYNGTTIVRGKAEGVVIGTGLNTMLGDIAQSVQNVKNEETPLQAQLMKFSRQLGIVVVIIAFLFFIIGSLKDLPVLELMTLSIALAVAAVPEGLLISLTVILAAGMRRMLKHKALIRRLPAAETLGSVSVLCTDKTGTITEGQMQAVALYGVENAVSPSSEVPSDILELLRASLLNNDASSDQNVAVGTPTEVALVRAAVKAGLDVDHERSFYKRVAEVPFSSEKKSMTTLHASPEKELLIMKGAPEVVIRMCNMTENERSVVTAHVDEMVGRGLRVLMFASTSGRGLTLETRDLSYLGLIGLQDPLREHAKETIATLKAAKVRVVVITGDHPDTARHIAGGAGLTVENGAMLTGSDLDQLSDQQLEDKIGDIQIIARAEPRHKVRMVAALKSVGEVVAMVGDGVNDAPALKAADIGIAVGQGTDVTKASSDMVLVDNNISTISHAVREGRVIYDNLQKVIVYLLTDGFTQIVLLTGALIFDLPLPIVAAQILWINLISDGATSMALSFEGSEEDVMKRPPRDRMAPVINGHMKILIFGVGTIINLIFLGAYIFMYKEGWYALPALQTIMFTSLALSSQVYVFAVRSLRTSLFRLNPFANKWVIGAAILAFVLQLCAIYLPVFQRFLSTAALDLTSWLVVILLILVQVVAIELAKQYLNRQSRRQTA